jgi:enamine deaminase RidA (YjgF/YER057c/UK114 family)
MAAQSVQVFENLKTALLASGASLDHVVKITVFVTDLSGLQAFRDVRDRYFAKPPASSLVQVVRLVRPELLVEVEAVAVAPLDTPGGGTSDPGLDHMTPRHHHYWYHS